MIIHKKNGPYEKAVRAPRRIQAEAQWISDVGVVEGVCAATGNLGIPKVPFLQIL